MHINIWRVILMSHEWHKGCENELTRLLGWDWYNRYLKGMNMVGEQKNVKKYLFQV